MRKRRNTELPAGAPAWMSLTDREWADVYLKGVLKDIVKVLKITYPSINASADTKDSALLLMDPDTTKGQYRKGGIYQNRVSIIFDPIKVKYSELRITADIAMEIRHEKSVAELNLTTVTGHGRNVNDTMPAVVAILNDLVPLIALVLRWDHH